jgi:aminoglycoside/choline kinase family phosphotransferase
MQQLMEFKQAARTIWATGDYDAMMRQEGLYEVGERLVDRLHVTAGENVLDIACGTGNAAIPAARTGATVTGVDLTPEMLQVARTRAERAGVEVAWKEADAEDLPFEDGSFDVVVSTFGCMFAPRHGVAANEIARVLRPGGRIGLCTWTPEGSIGDFFRTVGAHLPPMPEFVDPPVAWGDEKHVRELFERTGVELDLGREVWSIGHDSIEAAVDCYTTTLGPTVHARRLAEAERRWSELRDDMIRLFERRFGTEPTSILEIGADGSNRSYYRLIGPAMETAVGAYGPDREENRAFIAYTRSFHGAGFPVPELYGYEEEAAVWLLEDLGDTSLFDALVAARQREDTAFPASMADVYRRVLTELPRFQVEGGRLIDFANAYPRAAFDKQSIRWDLNYFKYHFLKLAHVPFSEQRLEQDFGTLTWFLLQAETDHFLYRDFQSKNIMLCEGEPYFIDYQGGRKGAVHYDVASILYDAKAAIPQVDRDRLLEHYLVALSDLISVDGDEFREHYRGYVIIRVLQALGAYGYRGFFERKPRFLQSVPFAARNLALILERGLPVEVPELRSVLERIVDRYAGEWLEEETPGLTIRVTSFSYKRGYPQDSGGHGGGFVFDCRGLPNPGRQLEYTDQSGLDGPVIRFLESREEAQTFWRGVRQMVDAQIEEYLRRGFTSLSVSFGCTGGQHRSVYLAERMARHIEEVFPQVHVRVEHREREAWPRRLPDPRLEPDELEARRR